MLTCALIERTEYRWSWSNMHRSAHVAELSLPLQFVKPAKAIGAASHTISVAIETRFWHREMLDQSAPSSGR
jgi:hypothetical protein